MSSTLLFKKLSKAGMPLLWQASIAMLFILITSMALIGNEKLDEILNIIIASMTAITAVAGLIYFKKATLPWIFLITAIVLINFSFILSSFAQLGFNIESNIPFWLEEIGIVFIGLFAICITILFEKTHKITGISIDFSLLALSIICFTFLVSPNLLDTIIYQLNIEQQVLIGHLVLGSILISLLLLNYELLTSIRIKDLILASLVIVLSVHFYLEILISFNTFSNHVLFNDISYSLYQFAGVFALLHIATEDYDFDFDVAKTKRLGLRMLWIASITALLIVPLGVFYRWKFNLSAIDPFYIASASFFLSFVVILRIAVLLKNYENQRQKIKMIAFTDALTGLPNYLGLRSVINTQEDLLAISVNVEDFKSINELYDRSFGDKVLISLAKRIQQAPRLLYSARTNGDNFIAVFQTPKENIYSVFKDFEEALGVWDTVQNKRVAVPLTYGATHSSEAIGPEKLVRQAELALKTSRMNHTHFTLYNEKENDKLPVRDSLPRHELREILQQAIDQNYLPVHFQPIYDINHGELKALEMLIRVDSEEHGLLMPGQFLDQAKSYGLLTGLTRVCIHMVAKHYADLPKVTININVPPYMLNNPATLNGFINSFHDVDLPPERFCVEVTEDGDIPTEHLIPAIELLKAHGFSISMDDFGTGYSSLGRLSVLPVDSVKIDRSLLLAASSGDRTILESAINLVKRLGVSAVVEGVETLEQLDIVRQLGADSVQGYLFSKPIHSGESTNFSMNAAEIITEF